MNPTDTAFPAEWDEQDGSYVERMESRGMDIRTYIAAQALAGYLAYHGARVPEDPGGCEPEQAAEWASLAADALLEKLNGGTDEA